MKKQEPTSINILFADDDEDDRNFFKQALKELPLKTNLTTVNDGDELMNYLAENMEQLPDVVFLDINMPNKSGIECLEEIKQHKKLKGLPVVMFSTSYENKAINMLFKNGADIYVRKPNDLEQLKQVIQHALTITVESMLLNDKLKYILNARN